MRRATILIVSFVLGIAIATGTAAATATDSGHGPAAVGTASPAPMAANGSVNVTLSPRASTSDNGSFSEEPRVSFDSSIQLDNGSNYRLVVTDHDTGGTVTVTPRVTQNTSHLALFVRDPTGEFGARTGVAGDGGFGDADATLSGSITTEGITRMSVSLVDASTGQTIDSTGIESFVVGYNGTITATDHSGDTEIAVSREFLPTGLSASVELYNASARVPSGTNDTTTVSLTYDSARDEFVGTVPDSAVAGGQYRIVLKGTGRNIDFGAPMSRCQLQVGVAGSAGTTVCAETGGSGRGGSGGSGGSSQFTLDNQDTFVDARNGAWTQSPWVNPDHTIVLDNGSNYRFVVENHDTGAEVVLTPNGSANVSYLGLAYRNADGSLKSSPYLFVREPNSGYRRIPAMASVTGTVTTHGTPNLSVRLEYATNGTTRYSTGKKEYVVGYTGQITTEYGNNETEVVVPRDVLPRGLSLSATVYNASGASQEDTTDNTTVPLTYNRTRDAYVGSVPDSAVAGGQYHVTFRVTTSGRLLVSPNFNTDQWTVGVASGSSGPPAVVGAAPTDPDGDGLYEDVNGDGQFDLIDVQVLYVNRDAAVVTNNPSAYDFNGDGQYDLIDVQALYQQATAP